MSGHTIKTLRMRKLNLNLPSNYLQSTRNPSSSGRANETPEQHLNRIIMRGIEGPPKPNPKRLSKSQLQDLIDKLLSIKAKIEIKQPKWGMEINISGATAELHTGKNGKLGVTTDYSGKAGAFRERSLGDGITERISTQMGRPLRLEYKFKDLAVALTFSSNDEKSMSFDRWEFSVSWGNTGPDIFSLNKIFTAGEKGIKDSFGALKKLKSFDDVAKVKREMVPHFKPISESVKNAAAISKIKPGINIGISVQGPARRMTLPANAALDERRKSGIQVMGMITIRF